MPPLFAFRVRVKNRSSSEDRLRDLAISTAGTAPIEVEEVLSWDEQEVVVLAAVDPTSLTVD